MNKEIVVEKERSKVMKAIYFADKELEKRIRKILGRPEGDIFTSDVVNVERLHLNSYDDDKKLFDISPLAEFKALKELKLYNNKITDIMPLAGLVNLTHLELTCNGRITDISPLAGLINLTNLDLQNNSLSDITPLSGLVNLTYLDLTNNRIADITPLTELVNLTYLDLYCYRITDITPLARLVNLTHLNLLDNQITDITPLAGLVNLTELTIGNTNCPDITPLSGLINLTDLCLCGMNIIDITPLSGLVNLTDLDLSGNNITDFTPLKELEQLILNGGLELWDSHTEASFYLRYWPEESINIVIKNESDTFLSHFTVSKSDFIYYNEPGGYPFHRANMEYTHIVCSYGGYKINYEFDLSSWISIHLDRSCRQIIVDNNGIYLEYDLWEYYKEWYYDHLPGTVNGYAYLEFDSYDADEESFVFICKTEGFSKYFE